jgi:DNA-binding FrmR family transcriptional regulator
MEIRSQAIAGELQQRLRRIEGQTRGVQRMVDEGRDCREILQQLNAMQSALQSAKDIFMRAYAKDCLLAGEGDSAEQRAAFVDELFDLMARAR